MIISRYLRWAAVCLAVSLLFQPSSYVDAATAKKVLVVTVTKGFRHSSIPTAEAVLGGLAERSGLFSVDYARTDEDIAEKMTPQALAQYDGAIFANTTGDLPIPDPGAFLEWIASGKAFIGMHSASDTFHGFPKFIEMLGGEFLTHGPQVQVDVVNQDPDHPACRHFGPEFQIYDEIYILKSFHREKVHGLLTQHKHPNTLAPGDYPIAWNSEYGEGKVFYTSLGHREDVWTSRRYQGHVLGGIKWALGFEKGEASPQSTAAKLSEAEEKDGFKSIFNGVDLSGWKLRKTDGPKSWSVQNGMLVNTVKKDEHGVDLVTEEKFWNFTARFEYLIPKGSNSGFYLRGRHEVQIFDDFAHGKPSKGGNGAIYNVHPVSIFASRKPGAWQEVEATMIGNRVTVFLNGIKVHDNVEVNKATGSELDRNLDEPGSIFIQGDHGAIALRNIRVKVLD